MIHPDSQNNNFAKVTCCYHRNTRKLNARLGTTYENSYHVCMAFSTCKKATQAMGQFFQAPRPVLLFCMYKNALQKVSRRRGRNFRPFTNLLFFDFRTSYLGARQIMRACNICKVIYVTTGGMTFLITRR